MVSLTLVGFKDVLQICNTTIDSTVGLMQVIMPVLITLLVLIGFPITSAVLNPIFIGGVTFINVVFKNFLFASIAVAFAILVINNLSKNIRLKKLSSFIKQINLVSLGAMFTIYLGLVSMQGLYVKNIDNFTVKTAKFAIGNFIPVVGGFVSDSVDILLSSSQLIKGVFGGIGLVLLVAICLVPVIKILSIVIVYKVSAIVVEPIGEEGISSFLNEVANLMVLMLAAIIAITIMFFVTVAILTSISVVSQG
jgi:stage III sporulation protein AE